LFYAVTQRTEQSPGKLLTSSVPACWAKHPQTQDSEDSFKTVLHTAYFDCDLYPGTLTDVIRSMVCQVLCLSNKSSEWQDLAVNLPRNDRRKIELLTRFDTAGIVELYDMLEFLVANSRRSLAPGTKIRFLFVIRNIHSLSFDDDSSPLIQMRAMFERLQIHALVIAKTRRPENLDWGSREFVRVDEDTEYRGRRVIYSCVKATSLGRN
jgi:hypothetical protein